MYRGVEGTPIPQVFPEVTPEIHDNVQAMLKRNPGVFYDVTMNFMNRKGEGDLIDEIEAISERRKGSAGKAVREQGLIMWRMLHEADRTLPPGFVDPEAELVIAPPQRYRRENAYLMNLIRRQSPLLREISMTVYQSKRSGFLRRLKQQ